MKRKIGLENVSCPDLVSLQVEDTHEMCVICLGAEHMHGQLSKGAGCVHCNCFTVMKLYFHLAFFKGDKSQVSAPRGSCPVAAEAAQ